MLDPPLRFRIRPAVLRVRIAHQHPGASPAALVPEGVSAGLVELRRDPRGHGSTRCDTKETRMNPMEITEKERLSRKEAAARLRGLADALAKKNDVEFESGALNLKVRVPDEVDFKLEIEIDDDEVELESRLQWRANPAPSRRRRRPRRTRDSCRRPATREEGRTTAAASGRRTADDSLRRQAPRRRRWSERAPVRRTRRPARVCRVRPGGRSLATRRPRRFADSRSESGNARACPGHDAEGLDRRSSPTRVGHDRDPLERPGCFAPSFHPPRPPLPRSRRTPRPSTSTRRTFRARRSPR